MENISLLLNEALSPYQVIMGTADTLGNRRVAIVDEAGHEMFERRINNSQFSDHRALIDVVDGLHRDLLVAQGRLQPCMIAALQHAAKAPTAFPVPA